MKIDWEDLKEGITDNFFQKIFVMLFLFCACTGAYYWGYRIAPYFLRLLKIVINYL